MPILGGMAKHPMFENTGKTRVSVFLEQEDVAMVRQVADRAGTSQSEVIRRALREGCESIKADLDRWESADEEMQAAIEHEEHVEAGISMNPGGSYWEQAAGELGDPELDAMSEDDRTLWQYRIHCKAWELREADEAEYKRQMEAME